MSELNQPERPWMMVAVRPAGKRVVIIGSGIIARRRADQFASRGARVEMFDPNEIENAEDIPANVTVSNREITKGDLEETWLVVVATDDALVNVRVGRWANELGIACNRTDDAEQGTLAVPAIMEDDLGWKVAVLGGDAGPLFSAWIKGLVGHVVASERVGQVYTAMASARFAADILPLEQRQRAFLLRKALTRILETPEDLDGAELVRKLFAER